MKPVTTLLDCGLLIQSEPGSSLSLRLDQTLDCGQCFTFSQTETDTCLPDMEQTWHGWAKGHALRISSCGTALCCCTSHRITRCGRNILT